MLIEPLTRSHDLQRFNCDDDGPLDRFLKRHALQSAQSGAARTYVMQDASDVIGYYSLCPGSVEQEDGPQRMKKGLARHPIPIILLARLAVAKAHQGRGIGPLLLKDAILRSLSAMAEIGGRALVVHAKDDRAKAFYEHFDFMPFDGNAHHLYALEKDLRALLA